MAFNFERMGGLLGYSLLLANADIIQKSKFGKLICSIEQGNCRSNPALFKVTYLGLQRFKFAAEQAEAFNIDEAAMLPAAFPPYTF